MAEQQGEVGHQAIILSVENQKKCKPSVNFVED
jgi:hypothetical protein